MTKCRVIFLLCGFIVCAIHLVLSQDHFLQPSRPVISYRSPKSVIVSWVTKSDPVSFVIQYKPHTPDKDWKSCHEIKVSGKARKALLPHLQSSTLYRIRVNAVYGHTNIRLGRPGLFQTQSNTLTTDVGVPQNIGVRYLSHTKTTDHFLQPSRPFISYRSPKSVIVSWVTKSDPVSFVIQYKPHTPEKDWKGAYEMKVSGKARKALILHLQSSTFYRIRLNAVYDHTNIQLGRPGLFQTKSNTLTDVGVPQNIGLRPVSSSQLRVEWNIPTGFTEDDVVHFSLIYGPLYSPYLQKTHLLLPGNYRSFPLSFLRPNTMYKLKLAALLKDRKGPFSAWTVAETFPQSHSTEALTTKQPPTIRWTEEVGATEREETTAPPLFSATKASPSTLSLTSTPKGSSSSSSPLLSLSTTSPSPSASHPISSPSASQPMSVPSASNSRSSPSMSHPRSSLPASHPRSSLSVSNQRSSPLASQPTSSPSASNQRSSPLASQPTSAPSVSNQRSPPSTSQPTSAPSVSNQRSSPLASQPTSAPSVSNQRSSPLASQPTSAPSVSNQRSSPSPSQPTSASNQRSLPSPSQPTSASNQRSSPSPSPSQPTSASNQRSSPSPSTSQPTSAPSTSQPTSAPSPSTSQPTSASNQRSSPSPSTSQPTSASNQRSSPSPSTSQPTSASNQRSSPSPSASQPTSASNQRSSPSPSTSQPTSASNQRSSPSPSASQPTSASNQRSSPSTSQPTSAPSVSNQRSLPLASQPTSAPSTSQPTSVPSSSHPTSSASQPTSVPSRLHPTSSPPASHPTSSPSASHPISLSSGLRLTSPRSLTVLPSLIILGTTTSPTPTTKKVCEKLVPSMCSDIGYDDTSMTSNQSQNYMIDHVNTMWASLSSICTSQSSLKQFLCAAMFPYCNEQLGGSFPPCQSMCEATKKRCNMSGDKRWPSELACYRFPEVGEKRICIAYGKETPVTTPTSASVQLTKPTLKPTTFTSTRRITVTRETKEKGTYTLVLLTPPVTTNQCETLSIGMCRGVGYKFAQFPNYFNHKHQYDAAIEVYQFWPLVEVKCSPLLTLFLCSLYAPMCTVGKERNQGTGVTLPCRSVCLKVNSECGLLMTKFGFKWPQGMECENFPDDDEETCLDGNVQFAGGVGNLNGIQRSTPTASYQNTQGTQASVGKTTSTATQSAIVAVTNSKTITFGKIKTLRTPLREPDAVSTIRPETIPRGTLQCETLSIGMCRGVGYKFAQFPNYFKQKQYDAAIEVYQFWPLVEVKCSPLLTFFLCSLYAPMCTVGKERNQGTGVILPCRSVCLKVNSECGPLMRKFGFKWPQGMECENFPYDDEETCLDGNVQFAGSVGNLKGIQRSAPTGTYQNTLAAQASVGKTTSTPTQPALKEPDAVSTILPETSTRGTLQCEALSIGLCRGVGYKFAQFPNYFKQKHQYDAAFEVYQFWPLVEVNCSSLLTLFLCSLYAPMCTVGKERNQGTGVTLPCRSVCLKVNSECGPLMTKFGFKWPQGMECENFPYDNEETCLDGNDDITKYQDEQKWCQRLPRQHVCRSHYTNASLSRRFGHSKQGQTSEVIAKTLASVRSFASKKCIRNLEIYLCSLYSPRCSETVTEFLPCRSLCKTTLRRCSVTLRRLGYDIPGLDNCRQFPKSKCTGKERRIKPRRKRPAVMTDS